MNDIHSLSHSKWNCKYHIVFAPKYRRKVFYETKRLEIGQILRQLCNWYGANLLEAEACPDHIHILVEIPPKHSVSSFLLKTASKERNSTAIVVVFIPPAVEPGEPPISISTIIIVLLLSLICARSTVLKPAVRVVTD